MERRADGTGDRRGRVWLLSLGVGVAATLLLATAASALAFAARDDRVEAEAGEGFVFFGEGVRLTAFFSEGRVRLLFSDGQEVVLDQAISASGARFTDGETLFWNRGDEARVEWQGQSFNTRIATPDNDVWERARQAGVRFRAVGQEPGWLLEIGPGPRLSVVLDYGETTMTLPVSEFHIDYGTRERTFTVKPPLSPVDAVVRIVQEACHDAMSGEGFTSSVTVTLPGTGAVYAGCGRDL